MVLMRNRSVEQIELLATMARKTAQLQLGDGTSTPRRSGPTNPATNDEAVV